MYERTQKNIFQKYKDLKDKVSVLIFIFDMILDLIEKIDKLLHWEDKNASFTFLIVLFFGFMAVTFMPLRYFAVLGGKSHIQ